MNGNIGCNMKNEGLFQRKLEQKHLSIEEKDFIFLMLHIHDGCIPTVCKNTLVFSKIFKSIR